MAVDTSMVQTHDVSLFEVAVEQFNIAADVVGLDEDMRRVLSVC